MPLLFYTTKVPVTRTMTEVAKLLAKAGARAVTTAYDEGEPTGLSFYVGGVHGTRGYTMPVNTAGVLQVLTKQRKAGEVGRPLATREHAARVAWRIAKEWLQVQLALVEAGMATVDQIMLPYLHVDQDGDGRPLTLYDRYRDHEQRALAAGGDA
jgi:hypothetical protein